MKDVLCLAIGLGAVVSGTAFAEIDLFPATYTCERGVKIPAAYANSDGDSVVTLNIEGRQITLVQTRAASGAKYIWPSDGSGYIWWTKGDQATLFWTDPEQSHDVTLYAECRSQ